jgi:hypothetical protein
MRWKRRGNVPHFLTGNSGMLSRFRSYVNGFERVSVYGKEGSRDTLKAVVYIMGWEIFGVASSESKPERPRHPGQNVPPPSEAMVHGLRSPTHMVASCCYPLYVIIARLFPTLLRMNHDGGEFE